MSVRYKIPLQPPLARDHFASIQAELSDDAYNSYCRAILRYGKCIVEELRVKQSDIEHHFARLLQKLASQLLPEQPNSTGPSLASDTYADAEDDFPGYSKGSSSRQNLGKAPAGRRASAASSRFEPYSKANKKANDNPHVALLQLFKAPPNPRLDCQVYRWYVAHGMMPPCHGCEEKHMNGVRQHLLPSYSQQHVGIEPGHVPYMQRCGHCTEDIIDQAAWTSGGHEGKSCFPRTQPRGMGVIVWTRLFLKIFPEETNVPSPYRNDPRYLPSELVDAIRQDLQSSTSGSGSSDVPTTSSTPTEELAALLTLMRRASHFFDQLKAELQLRLNHNIGNINELEVEYHEQLEQLRNSLSTQPQLDPGSLSHVPHSINTNTFSHAYPGVQQVQAPITGAADFGLPRLQLDPYAGVIHLPGSDVDTQPSTQQIQQSNASFGLPSASFFSSQTDYDNGGFMFQDQTQTGPLNCPPSAYFPEDQASQYGIQHDPRLSVPGNSRLPQLIVDQYTSMQQMAADVDQAMEVSPMESHARTVFDQEPSLFNEHWRPLINNDWEPSSTDNNCFYQ